MTPLDESFMSGELDGLGELEFDTPPSGDEGMPGLTGLGA